MEDEIEKYFHFLERIYNSYYILPDLDINDKEWNALFDVIYKYTTLKKENNFFYGYLHVITIEVLNKALIQEDEFITLNSFLARMDVLGYLGFSRNEINSMKKEILEKASFGKILNLNDYKKMA